MSSREEISQLFWIPFDVVVSMTKENPLLVTDEPFEAREFMRIADHFKGIYGIYLNLMRNKILKRIERSQHVTNWT